MSSWSTSFKKVVVLLDFLYICADIKATEVDDDEEIPKFLERRGYEQEVEEEP